MRTRSLSGAKPATSVGWVCRGTNSQPTQEAAMARPAGRPPQVNEEIKITLTDADKRRVDQLCQVMNVGYSEFFRLLLAGAFELARECNEKAARPLEAVR